MIVPRAAMVLFHVLVLILTFIADFLIFAVVLILHADLIIILVLIFVASFLASWIIGLAIMISGRIIAVVVAMNGRVLSVIMMTAMSTRGTVTVSNGGAGHEKCHCGRGKDGFEGDEMHDVDSGGRVCLLEVGETGEI